MKPEDYLKKLLTIKTDDKVWDEVYDELKRLQATEAEYKLFLSTLCTQIIYAGRANK
jgi:hypothetical protein